MRAFPGYAHLFQGIGLTILAVLTSTCTPDRIPSAPSLMATHLVFTAQPSSAVAGVPIGAITVKALDSSNNVVADFRAVVTIAIANNATGATLSGITAVTAVAGVATFSNLTVDKVGTGYTLVATATGLTSNSSVAFDITAVPCCRLAFTVQPTTTTAGAAITPPVQVRALDPAGNTDTTFVGNVAIAFGTDPSGGILSAITVKVAVAGVATFSNITVDKAGIGYTLTATSPAQTGAVSTPFDITAGAAARLVCTLQPSNPSPGTMITPIQAAVEDTLGNIATAFAGNVTATIGAPPGGTLSGIATVSAVAGVATFSNLSIPAGSGYTVIVSSPGLMGATCGPF